MKIGMFYFSDPALTPLVTNPARMLAEAGYRVDIVAYHRLGNTWGIEQLEGIRWVALNRPGMDFSKSGLFRVRDLFHFVRQAVRLARKEGYDLIYGHDMHGFLAAHQVARSLRVPLIYHCHDLAQYENAGWLDRWIKRYEVRFGLEAACVILPESRRAALMKQQNRLTKEPLVVWNCPLKGDRPHADRLRELLGQDKDGVRYVIRHGSLWSWGDGHSIEETIASIPYWPEDAGLMLLGTVGPSYARNILDWAKAMGVSQRVHLFPPVKHEEVFDFIGGAHLGLALYQPVDINKTYQSTASLKFFEYLRAGIPVLVPDEPGFKALIDQFQCGIAVDPTDPRKIAEAVNELLTNEPLRQGLGENGFQAHAKECNYQIQYRPVLEFIHRLLSS